MLLRCRVFVFTAFSGRDSKAHCIQARIKTMAEGTIKRKTDRGFGFIETGDNKDMFFHMSNLEGVEWDDLREGQKVTFEIGEGPKGPRAEQVRPA